MAIERHPVVAPAFDLERISNGSRTDLERISNGCRPSTDDPGTGDAPRFLMTREITPMKVFMSAPESMGKSPFEIGLIPPTPGGVDQYFNDSTGGNEEGDEDITGPWNKSNGMKTVQPPPAHRRGDRRRSV